MSRYIKAFWPVFVKVVLPSVVASVGTTAAALDSELFLRFCGLH